MGFFDGIAGAVVSGGLSFLGGKAANKETAASTQAQLEFQERMARTRYQMTMADMKAAGLNPILAYKQGAVSPPTGTSYQAQNVGAAAASAFGTGTSAMAQHNVMKETLRNMQADTTKKYNETDKLSSEIVKTNQETRESLSRQKLNEEMLRIQKENLTTAKKAAIQADMDTALIKQYPFLRTLGAIGRELGITGSSAIQQLRK